MSASLIDPSEDRRDAELRKLRKINRVLMDRVERDMDAHGGNAYALFRTAITLEMQVSERTAELTRIARELRGEIAQRRQAERELQAAKAEADQANLSKTRFLAAATHDLSQPINAARLFLGAIADELSTDRSRDLLGRIDAALDTVDELLGSLLDISKLDAGAWPVHPTHVAVGTMLTRLADEYRPQADAAGLELRVVPCGAVVRTDRSLFERVLRNFISNAIRYTAEGRILIGCRRRAGRLHVQVWDSGIGIPDDQRQAIFGEFQRLSQSPRRDGKGLGLGLAIVDRIARLLDLRVDVESTLGRGSCFSVEMAISPEDAGEPAIDSQHAEVSTLAGRCIVIVDNDDSERNAMRELLEGWGCSTLAARSAEDAAPRLPLLAAAPHLIVADFHLDNGRRGTDAVTALRVQCGTRTPALVISGDRSDEVRAAVKQAGMAFLAKPIRPARLRAMISYLIQPPAGC